MKMREEAERYCSLIENAESYTKKEFAGLVSASIASLLDLASRLPQVPNSDAETPDGPSHAQWKDRFDAIQITLDDWGDYWTTLTATEINHIDRDAVLLTLADDLADIWRDLKAGLSMLDDGANPTAVVWHWRFSFYAHWGRHATEAMRALHARLAEDLAPFYDPP